MLSKQKTKTTTKTVGCSSLKEFPQGMDHKFTTLTFPTPTGYDPKTELISGNHACCIICCRTSVSAALSQIHFELWFELVEGQRWHTRDAHRNQKEQRQKRNTQPSLPTSWGWRESKPPSSSANCCMLWIRKRHRIYQKTHMKEWVFRPNNWVRHFIIQLEGIYQVPQIVCLEMHDYVW